MDAFKKIKKIKGDEYMLGVLLSWAQDQKPCPLSIIPDVENIGFQTDAENLKEAAVKVCRSRNACNWRKCMGEFFGSVID